jgi:prolyl oligopeptidase
MKKCLGILMLIYHSALSQQIKEVPLPEGMQAIDTIFGKTYEDPFRGLEKLDNPTVSAWIAQKNQQAQQFLSSREVYQSFARELRQMQNFSPVRASVPVVNGKDTYALRYLADTGEQHLFLFKHALDTGRLLFSTHDIAGSDSLDYSIDSINPSPDNRYIAVCGFADGNDQMEIRVFDRSTGKFAEDIINASLSYYPYWLPDSQAFFYTQLSIPSDAVDWFDHVRVKLHKVGQPQDIDQPILQQDFFAELPYQAGDFPTLQVLPDSVTVRCSIAHGYSQYLKYYIAPLSSVLQPGASQKTWTELSPGQDIINALFDEQYAYLLIQSDDSTTQIIRSPLYAPDASVVLFSESEGYISEIEVRREGLYAELVRDGISQLLLFNEEQVANISLPFPGNITLTAEAYQDKVSGQGIYFGLSGWKEEFGIYYYDLLKDTVIQSAIRPKAGLQFAKDLVVEEVLVTSHDQEKVPLTIIYKKGLRRDQRNPAILEAYGAYGISLEPYLDVDLLSWLNRGGVIAKAHIRGGGEKGTSWHTMGRKASKPNSWKDLLACSEYLIKQGYTSPRHLGLYGNSAGGIAVGMALLERAELFNAAVLEYPFLNPTRLAESADGVVHYEEFGDPADSLEFTYLYRMDPYLHLQEKDYPAVLLTAGENDTRVEPWEPAKFAARMEAVRRNTEVTLLRVYSGGHGTTGIEEFINQQAEKLTFLYSQLHPQSTKVLH